MAKSHTETEDAPLSLALNFPEVGEPSEQTGARRGKGPHIGRRQQGVRRAPTYGAAVARQTMFEAILSQGEPRNIHLFVPPHTLSNAATYLSGHVAAGRLTPERISIHPFSPQPHEQPGPKFDVWHDLAGSMLIPLKYRALRSGLAFPVTTTHHTISYHHLIESWITRLLLCSTYPFDSIICTSTSSREALAHLIGRVSSDLSRELAARVDYNGRFDVIPLGVDTDRFCQRNKREVRKKLRLPVSDLVLLCFGRLSAVDKADLVPLLIAIREIAKDSTIGKFLLVVGTSRLESNYGRWLAEQVRDLGLARCVVFQEYQQSERHLVFSAADIFISLADNIQETFGITPVEAMAAGVPQIVSDWNGYRDTVVDGKTGFRVPTHWIRCDGDLNFTAPLTQPGWERDHLTLSQSVSVDLEGLCFALRALATNDGLRAKMAEESRARAVREYRWERIICLYLELWRELAAASKMLSPRAQRLYRPAYFRAAYCDDFGHYASQLLSSKSILVPSDLGLGLERPPRPFGAMQFAHLDSGLLSQLLGHIRKAATAQAALGITIGDMSKQFSTTGQPEYIYRHIMWLIKYGLVRVLSPKSDGPQC